MDVVYIDAEKPFQAIGRHAEASIVQPSPMDVHDWRKWAADRLQLDESAWRELHGGFNNLVVARRGDRGGVQNDRDRGMIVWRDPEYRAMQGILTGLLTEHALDTHFEIPSRTLQMPEEPIRIENGLLVSDVNFVPGERRWPWNGHEIFSAGGLLARLHHALRHITYDPGRREPYTPDYHLQHGDPGRGNLLFREGSADAYAVIDLERILWGSPEYDAGKTLSLILVDSQVKWDQPPSSLDEAVPLFEARAAALLRGYDSLAQRPLKKEEVLKDASAVLHAMDYGSLNLVRKFALEWLNDQLGIDV